MLTFLKGCKMNNEKQSAQVFENLLFPKVFETFRIAIYYKNMMIAFVAVAVICLVGWLMDFSQTVVVDEQSGITELQVYMEGGADAVKEFRQMREEAGPREGVFSTLWHVVGLRFHDSLGSLAALNLLSVAQNVAYCIRAIVWAFRCHFIYCVIFGLIKLAVISFAGGAICRFAALQFARGEKPGLIEVLRFTTRKFLSLFAAPLAPIGIIIVIGFFVFLLGLMGNIRWAGELIMAIFMLLALLAGFLITIIIIGAVAGFNLMFPAVVYSGADCFEAISHAFSYVYSKPWRMAFYTALAAVYGAICYIFVRLFAFVLLIVTYGLLDVGVFGATDANKLARIWAKPEFFNLLGSNGGVSLNWSEGIAAFVVYLLVLAVVGLVLAFIVSFYFSANTIIYSLMRNRVDNTALDDIYIYSEEAQTEPGGIEAVSDESLPQAEAESDSSSTTE